MTSLSTRKRRWKDAASGMLFVLPSFVLIMVFSIIPIGMTIYYSFTKYNVMQPPVWVALENYQRMMGDQFVNAAIFNTIRYTLIVVPVQTILALMIAALLAARFRGRFGGFVKSTMFVPVISSAVLVGTLFLFVLSTDEGAINRLLMAFGIPKVNWMGTTQTALYGICMAAIWKNVGYFMVIFYAGIMDIPVSLYEAARVDGASPVQQFMRITVPMLKPVTFLCVILGTIWSFQVFDLVYIMTNGGPGKATTTLVLNIYNYAFKEFSMGYACSISVLLFAIVVVISAVQKFLFRDKE